MNGAVVAAAAIAGAGAGLGSGLLAVWLERAERLEEEEHEEREAYEREGEEAAAAALAEGRAAPPRPPWLPERYGWTWLERVLSPLLAALGFAAFAAHDDAWGALLIHLLWVAVLTHIAVFDLKHRLILDKVSLPAAVVAVGLSAVSPGLTLRNAVVGAVAVYAFFLVQSLVLGGSVLGMGDAKLGAVVGATTGIGFDLDHLGAVYAVIAAVLSAGVVAILLLMTRLRRLKDPIPYGPFLCAGAALIMFHGPAGP